MALRGASSSQSADTLTTLLQLFGSQGTEIAKTLSNAEPPSLELFLDQNDGPKPPMYRRKHIAEKQYREAQPFAVKCKPGRLADVELGGMGGPTIHVEGSGVEDRLEQFAMRGKHLAQVIRGTHVEAKTDPAMQMHEWQGFFSLARELDRRKDKSANKHSEAEFAGATQHAPSSLELAAEVATLSNNFTKTLELQEGFLKRRGKHIAIEDGAGVVPIKDLPDMPPPPKSPTAAAAFTDSYCLELQSRMREHVQELPSSHPMPQTMVDAAEKVVHNAEMKERMARLKVAREEKSKLEAEIQQSKMACSLLSKKISSAEQMLERQREQAQQKPAAQQKMKKALPPEKGRPNR